MVCRKVCESFLSKHESGQKINLPVGRKAKASSKSQHYVFQHIIPSLVSKLAYEGQIPKIWSDSGLIKVTHFV